MNCADCGQEVRIHRGNRWAVELSPPAKGSRATYSFTCRSTIQGTKLIRADYHYVEGETQRHWPPD